MDNKPSPAIAAICNTLQLADAGCVVVVVHSAGRSRLGQITVTHWLQEAGFDVQPLGLTAIESLDALPAQSIVVLSGSQWLTPEQRTKRFAQLNIRRDQLLHAERKLVLWCTPEALEDLWQAAPDLVHVRSLLQVLEPEDTPVFNRSTYLAWCVDTYSDISTDRVLQAGGRMLRNPIVGDSGKFFNTFAHWLALHQRSILGRRPPQDPSYPARSWAEQSAAYRLGGGQSAIPVLLEASKLQATVRGSEPLVDVPQHLDNTIILAWTGVVVCLIDDLVDGYEAIASTIRASPIDRWCIVTNSVDTWKTHLGWPDAFVALIFDFLPDFVEFLALHELVCELFTASSLGGFIHHRYETLAPVVDRGVSLDDLARSFLGTLVAERKLDQHFFEFLLEVRPQHKARIEQVRTMFHERGLELPHFTGD
ncbi:MAG: hypothetical protein ACPG4T_04150 [Nannocystaceae bacterium]